MKRNSKSLRTVWLLNRAFDLIPFGYAQRRRLRFIQAERPGVPKGLNGLNGLIGVRSRYGRQGVSRIGVRIIGGLAFPTSCSHYAVRRLGYMSITQKVYHHQYIIPYPLALFCSRSKSDHTTSVGTVGPFAIRRTTKPILFKQEPTDSEMTKESVNQPTTLSALHPELGILVGRLQLPKPSSTLSFILPTYNLSLLPPSFSVPLLSPSPFNPYLSLSFPFVLFFILSKHLKPYYS